MPPATSSTPENLDTSAPFVGWLSAEGFASEHARLYLQDKPAKRDRQTSVWKVVQDGVVLGYLKQATGVQAQLRIETEINRTQEA